MHGKCAEIDARFLRGVRGLLSAVAIVLLPWLQSGCAPSEPVVIVTMKPAEASPGASAEGAPQATAEGAAKPAETAAATGGVGDLQGTIVFDGAPPSPEPLIAQGADVRDKAVCAAVAIPKETLLVDPETKGVMNVFFYLEKAPAGVNVAPPEGDVIFDQKGCRFRPHALLMRTKQTVLVLNDDSVLHNTHTFPERNPGFNQGIAVNERKGVALKYNKPEKQPLEVKCDVHTWMLGYHLPLDHPFAALTDEKGKFEIKGLPAGTHKFRVWHEKAGLLEREYKVQIKGGEVTPVTLSLGAAKFAAYNGAPSRTLDLTTNVQLAGR